uniref:Uncharacterized protein n=1 Tax=Anopheles atroparvus TaxID=41427 RepID=A0A182IXP8_ANOAO
MKQWTNKITLWRASSSFKHNASFVARLPTIRRHKSQSLHSPGNQKPPSGGGGRTGRCPRVTDINASSENLEVTNNGRPMNPSLSEDSVAETALSKKNSDAGLELASISSIPGGAGPLVATGNDLVVGRSFLSTGGGHFGGGSGGPSSSRRSSFVSGIFSSAVQRRGSGNESHPHATNLSLETFTLHACAIESLPSTEDHRGAGGSQHRYRIVRFRAPFESLFRSRSASAAIATAAAATAVATSGHLAGSKIALYDKDFDDINNLIFDQSV